MRFIVRTQCGPQGADLACLGIGHSINAVAAALKLRSAASSVARCSAALPEMAAANASARGQRVAILASPLHELTGFYLAASLAPRCAGERTFAVAELASFYGRDRTVGTVVRRMRCSGACDSSRSAAAGFLLRREARGL